MLDRQERETQVAGWNGMKSPRAGESVVDGAVLFPVPLPTPHTLEQVESKGLLKAISRHQGGGQTPG